ncbi:MAG TPA: UvrD-helicase domain-containing protein [Planctomycetota bacterium]|nr:UvrD-helicase domain-containing protein [Planctomycetota bacterium]
MKPPLKDLEVRRRAAHSRENVAVTAGAGTGKTTLLIDAVMARILDRGIDARRILMMTFTEKAAAEMRIRLEQRLRAVLDPQSDADREERARWEGPEVQERAKAALAVLDRAEISTIHGFCAHLLREFPIEAGLDPAFAIDEGPKRDELFAREWDRWLDVELGPAAPRRAAWLKVLAGLELYVLREVAEGLCSFDVPDEALDADRILASGRVRLHEVCADVEARLRQIASRHPGPNNLRTQLLEIADFLKSPTREEPGKSASQAAKGWKPEDFAEAQSVLKDALALARDAASVDEPLAREALALLCDLAAAFRRTYAREGFVSFSGLLMRVRSLLRSDAFPEAREAVKAKYDFVVVDEVQDTDPVQCEIVLFLAEERGKRAESAAEVKLARGRLFIVGDPKQSIYSFRGADIVAYDRLKNQIVGQGGEPHVLRTNFRSHSGIIGVVNTLFARIIRRKGELQPEYEEIFAHEDRAPGLPSQKVEAVLFEGAKKELSSREAREAEAEEIARWIKSSVKKLRIRAPDTERPMEYRDVAILLKALTDVHLLLERLRAHGVPYVVEGEKYYYGTQEVIDFVNLLRAVSNPFDRVALAGLLRSPLGAVKDPTLLDLAKADALDYRMKDPPKPVAGLYAMLADLHGRHRRMSVPALIDETFTRTGILALAGLSYHGPQAVANLLKMRRAAEEFEASGATSPTLASFLTKVRRDVRELTDEGESPLADEALDAVRILSIHKSKGLEFPVVFVPDLHRMTQEQDDRAVRYDWPAATLGVRAKGFVDPGGAALGHLWKVRQREEARRVLYVAFTRARERLAISAGAEFPTNSPMAEIARALKGAADIDLETMEGEVTSVDFQMTVRRVSWKESPPPSKRAKARTAGERTDWKALDGRWKKREEETRAVASSPRFTSPTALQESRAERAQVATDEEQRSRAAEIGTLCHLVLERIDFRKPDISKLVEEGARELGIEDASEARKILAAFVKSAAFKTLAGAEIVARELPFFLKVDGTILQGAIDLVARIDGRLTVIDYKSDREEHPEKYAEQKRWYLEAVKRILGEKKPEFKLLYLRSGRLVTP